MKTKMLVATCLILSIVVLICPVHSPSNKILGKNTVGASWYGFSGRKFGTRFECLHDGTLTILYAYVGYNGATDFDCKMAVYEESSMEPKSLLATSDATLFTYESGQEGWMNFTIEYEVRKGQFYWVTFMAGDRYVEEVPIPQPVKVKYDAILDDFSAFNLDDYADGFSNPFEGEVSATYQKKSYSMYGEIEGGSAGGNTPDPPWLKVRWDAICEHLKEKVGSPLWQIWATLHSKLQKVLPAMGMLAVFFGFLGGVWILFLNDKPKNQQSV